MKQKDKTHQKSKKSWVLRVAIAFGIGSLILNLLSIWLLDAAHIYDIVHAIPVIFIYQPIIEWLGGGMPEPIIYVPLAVLLDALMGAIIGWGVGKWIKKDTYLWIGILVSFAIYWIAFTFQWLLIL
ncbi:MAG: hypothetical protein ACRCW2_03200 [Cellulosilyticaceae bacterium]